MDGIFIHKVVNFIILFLPTICIFKSKLAPMNSELMIRLFKAIEGDSNDDIIKIANKIVEEENKLGHSKLALKLKDILKKNVQSYTSFRGELKSILPKGVLIPTDKRYNIPLATHIEREKLRHEMVLAKEIENKIKQIE